MKIDVVQLENIRSHVKSTVPFARGFNCLVGGLGCGKSSILYAVDFALFGEPLGKGYDYLLREGAEAGRVTLQFYQNGKNYKIIRGLKRRGKSISQEFDELKLYEDGTLIASMKSDAVAEQLKSITGLDVGLFREIIWVRQEHLKELIDVTPRERQRRIDELFSLSEYETAWSSLYEYIKKYEGKREAYAGDPDVVGIERLNVEYNRTVEELSAVESELEEKKKALENAKKALDEACSNLKRLEELKAQIELHKRREAQIQTSLANVEEESATLNEKIEQRKKIIEGLKKSLASIEARANLHKTKLDEVGISPNQPIEGLRQYLTYFEDQISSLKAEQESALKDVREDQRRVAELLTERRCPTCLQPLNDEYKGKLLQRIREENIKRQKTINELQHEISELQRVKNVASDALANLQTLTMQAENLKSNIRLEENLLADLMLELEEKQKTKRDLNVQLEILRAEISRFDFSHLEYAKNQRDEAYKRALRLESELKAMVDKKEDLVRRLDDVKERIDNAQKKVEQIEQIGKIINLIGDIRNAYRSIQPKLRSDFISILRSFTQQILDSLVNGEGASLSLMVDETYTPYIKNESGVQREVSTLSGGERTLIAFAYRLGLGQLIMQSRTGHGLSMLLLDEPTESLGSEDGSIDRLAEAISRLKAIEQIISVTHSEAFAEKADHVIRLEKEFGKSKVTVEV